MRWQDVSVDGVWTIPAEAREKGNAPSWCYLKRHCRSSVPAQDCESNSSSSRAAPLDPLRNFYTGKERFDAEVKIAPWTLHDLRRTARRACWRVPVFGPVLPNKFMGHVITGVEGTYDRHTYAKEKANALVRLAALVSRH